MNREKMYQDKVEKSQEAVRLPYEKPSLLMLGKVISLTMGSIPGIGESGSAGNFVPRG
jgi:hypothetical protein